MATSRVCTVEGCDLPYRASGYCSKHYARWYTHGDPLHERRPQSPRPKPKVECSAEGCQRYAVVKNLGVTRRHRYQGIQAVCPGSEAGVSVRSPHRPGRSIRVLFGLTALVLAASCAAPPTNGTTTTTTTPAPPATLPDVPTAPPPSPPVDEVPGPVAGAPGEFVRRVDVGPQASTFGHVPAGALKPWPHPNVINEDTAARGADGWITISGYEFVGRVRIEVGNVRLVNCRISAGSTLTSQTGGLLYTWSNAPEGEVVVDHCHIDQGTSGYSMSGIDIYQPLRTTVRYSLIEGSGDGIKANSGGLYHDNFINVKAGSNSQGHMDGIQGSYYKVGWTARHNTIISGVGRTRPEAGGNIGVWASLDGAPYNYGVVVEGNYIDGFNTGVSLQGTDAGRPNVVRHNQFGTDFRYYPSLRIRTWTEYPHTLVEDNNVFDRVLDEGTGLTRPA